MKTQKLINKTLRLLREQEPGAEPSNAQPPAAPVPTEGPADVEVDEREKSLALALALAFIFNPARTKQEMLIKTQTDKINSSANITIPEIIDTLGEIVCLDINLCRRFREAFPGNNTALKKESKTIQLLNKYKLLFEQDLDATEPQSTAQTDDTAGEAQDDGTQNNNTPEEKTELSLDEIFPLYRDLLTKAVLYVPTDDELFMVNQVVKQFADSDPLRVIETVKNILRLAEEGSDDSLEQDLSEI
jgi:hypothetical protein